MLDFPPAQDGSITGRLGGLVGADGVGHRITDFWDNAFGVVVASFLPVFALANGKAVYL